MNNKRILDGQKVKQSLYRPGQALRAPRIWGFKIGRQSVYEGGKVINPEHWPSLPPGKYSWCLFLLDPDSTQGP